MTSTAFSHFAPSVSSECVSSGQAIPADSLGNREAQKPQSEGPTSPPAWDRRRALHAWAVACALGALVGPLATPASAATPAGESVAVRAKARRAFQEGEALSARGELAEALTRFRASAALVAAPNTLLAIARTLDRLGAAREAVEAYEGFIACAAPHEQEEVRARVAKLRETPGRVTLRGLPVHARVTVDAQAPIEGLPAELTLPPGAHHLLVEAEGFVSQEATVEVAFGATSSPTIELELAERLAPPPPLELGWPEPAPLHASPLPPSPASAASTPSWASEHRVALTLGGLAAGALAGGVFFGLEALAAERAFARSPSRREADRGELAGFRADIAFGTATLLGLTAAATLVSSSKQPRSSLRLAPFVGGGAAGLVAGGHF